MNLSAVTAIVVAILIAILAYRILSQPQLIHGDPVNRLWRAALNPTGETAYQDTVAEVDCAFAMFSVALDDALRGREEEPEQAGRLVEMSVELLGRFANTLESLASVLGQVSRTLHRLPQVRPLDPENFRSPSTVGLARRQALLHTVLLSSRMRFFQKLDGIQRAVERISLEYEVAAREVLTGGARSAAWQVLDHAHYDLNTLWRETEIVFKALLHYTPDELAQSLVGQFRLELARREAIERLAPKPSHSRIP